jgi:hypothetical protein
MAMTKLRHQAPRARTKVAIASIALVLAVTCPAVYSMAAQTRHTRAAHASTATLSSHFALLRTAASAPPPPALVAAAHRAPASYDLDIDEARQAASGTWLIPGAGWLCIATTDSEGLGMSCATAASAEQGELSFSQRTTAGGRERVVGAVPDGYADVSALADGPSSDSTPVRENTYSLSARNVSRVTLNQAP